MNTSTGDSVYRIDSRGCLTSVNAAWLRFAQENGAAELTRDRVVGRAVRDFVRGEVVCHLWEILTRIVRESGKPLRVPFRCDSPDERRFMEATLSALPNGEVEFACRLVRVEAREAVALLDRSVARSDQWLTVCAWCNRFLMGEGLWLEAEDAVRQIDLLGGSRLPNLTGGVCSRCHEMIVRKGS